MIRATAEHPRRNLQLWVVAILVAAAVLRFWSLDSRGVGHIELYTPNIPLPAGISDPPPRLTLLATFTGSLWEPHPPAWYLLNWPWTRLFGTSPVALRLPSVLVGVLAVWLLWRFAARERSAMTGVFAAALFSAHGLHIMWSQLSRPVVLVSALGIASSIMLLRLISSQAPGRFLRWYVILTLSGLATDHYYWFLLAGQIAWVFLAGRPSAAGARAVLRWQFLTMAVASPLITLAVAQSRESYLVANLFHSALNHAGFGFLFSPLESTVAVAEWMRHAAVFLGVVLAGIGFVPRSADSGPAVPAEAEPPRSRTVWWVVAGMTLVSAGWAFVLVRAGMSSLDRLLPTAVMPGVFMLVFTLAVALQRQIRIAGPIALSTVLSTVPAAIVLLVSTVAPLVDDKYFLVFTPFLLVLIADGMTWLLARLRSVTGRAAFVALVGLIAVIHVSSIRFFRGVDATPIDFRSLARALRPQLEESDRIFVYKHYAMTGIYYHLNLDAGRYVGTNHSAARPSANGRFWLISLRDAELGDPKSIQEAIAGCEVTRTITARRIRAELYERCGR